MAVAARPGPSDARVPCPLCGGLIHPIAGKCKHCKADLSSYRSARPAANAALPALHRAPGGNGHAPGHAAAPVRPPGTAPGAPPAAATAAPIATAHEVAQTVLPPRPTGSVHAAAVATPAWRSWPVLVIILATVAIVIAVVLMVWPTHAGERDGKRALQPPPAPERMDTQSGPRLDTPPSAPRPQAGAPPDDPWTQNQAPQAAPAAPRADLTDPAAPAAPADPDSADDDATDPFGAPSPPAAGGRHTLSLNGRGTVMLAMADHLCRKMVQCGHDDSMMKSMCDTVAHNRMAPPANCPAAERCLQHIDTMSCASQTDDLSQLSALLAQFRDCADAVRC